MDASTGRVGIHKLSLNHEHANASRSDLLGRMISGVNIAFVTRAIEPCATAARAHKQRRKTNHKLRFDDFKPKFGCNRPMYCQSEL
jgi:hypothetical protein